MVHLATSLELDFEEAPLMQRVDVYEANPAYVHTHTEEKKKKKRLPLLGKHTENWVLC